MNDEKPEGLHTTDVALIECAKTGEGAVPVTGDLLATIVANISERTADIEARYPALVEACPYELKLALVAWVFKHVVAHAMDGGSFRFLIYERLGFAADAYLPLYLAGGMTISNEFDLQKEA